MKNAKQMLANMMRRNAFDALARKAALESHLAMPAEWRKPDGGPLLVVDVSPVSYISAFRGSRKTEGKTDQAVSVEILSSVRAFIMEIVRDVKPSACVLAFDSPVPTYRASLTEGYKAGRAKAKAAERDQEKTRVNKARLNALDHLAATAGIWGWNVMRAEGYEADDLIAAFVHGLRVAPASGLLNNRRRIMVASNDSDLCQLLAFPAVDILDVAKRRYVTEKSFTDAKGYAPHLVPLVKAIGGDTSDDISGLKGVGDAYAVAYVTGGEITDRVRALIEDGADTVVDCYGLTALPFAGFSLKGQAFNGALDPFAGDVGEDDMPF